MTEFLFDLRDAVRGFRRDRMYALAVVATLALTLGAATAVFSIVDGVLLQPLGYRDADRLVSIREIVPRIGGRYPTLPANARHFDHWRRESASFAAMAALDWRTTNLTGAGEPMQIVMLRASPALFDVLQTPMPLGRALTSDDERRDRPLVAVITDTLWRERFGRDPAVLSRHIAIGGTPYAIVGVLPAGYQLPSFDALRNTAALTSKLHVVAPLRIDVNRWDWMGEFNFPVVARLKAGVPLDAARAEMGVLQRTIAGIAERETHERVALGAALTPLGESIVGPARRGLLLLLAAIGGVVLIACSNVANLSLTRTLSRGRDAALRAALGAGRARLMRRVVVEQLVLAAAGGALGLLVAAEALELFVRTAPIDLPRVNDVHLDGRVLLFAAALAAAAALAVAILPAWRVAGADVHTALRAGGYSATDAGGLRARAALVAAQVALSVMLLAATGLLVVSFVRLLRVDAGFSTDRVLAVEIAPIGTRYPDTNARAALYDRILDRVRALPGVASAAWTSALPLTGETWVDVVLRPDGTMQVASAPSANYRFVAPDYFRTLSMPFVAGRSFGAADRSQRVVPAVISARVAETLWPGRDPIGRRFTRADPADQFQVVGVVADGHATRLDAPSPLMVYVPYWFNNEGKSVLVVQSSGDAAAIAASVSSAVRQEDPEIAVDAKPLQHVVDASLAGSRYQMSLFVAFGIVALVIATLGVYATTAYGVSRRRREMNIRVALGARVAHVFGLVVRQSSTPVLVGLVVGCAGASVAGRAMASLLFESRAVEPMVLASVVTVVGVAAFVAAAVAAKQGLRIDPSVTLRDD